uniref:Alpha-1,3/1,6-mannosyltransferase ALG2 n=1 Tax=Culicoides sonorensis TaxID=179676 RepID=A0A336MK63_CULSO
MVKILFVHPDLGIGGAERLVVDAALALQNKGHTVRMLTNHHDPNHCFEETKDGTLDVMTVGDFLPRNIFGKFYAVCAYFRMVYAAFYYVFCLSKTDKYDLIFIDLISLGIPIFRLAKHSPKILFYCHFPDQLLAKPGGNLKQLYRLPLNYLEEKTTGQADGVLVNSKFTSRVFKETFKTLDVIPEVLYPSLNTEYFDQTVTEDSDTPINIPNDAFVFFSINRYERKKNLGLALYAFKQLEAYLTKAEWEKVYLIMAGGYDTRVLENVEHYEELEYLCEELSLSSKVTFLLSPSDREKLWLLKRSQVLIYTPSNEHFGIVPLEGMYLHKPVIAVNSGGPTETIIDDQTGYLCDANAKEFAKAMLKLVRSQKLLERMGDMGHKRVQQRFSFAAFSDKLDSIVKNMIQLGRKDK